MSVFKLFLISYLPYLIFIVISIIVLIAFWLGFLHLPELIFTEIFLIVLIAFLFEFKITSKQSWVVLLGLTALGGFFAFQTWRRKKLLEQFEEREKALKDLEQGYESLKKQAKITEEAYQKARHDLDQAKIETGLAVMKADQELAEKIKEIEREYQNLTVEESLKKIREALQSK